MAAILPITKYPHPVLRTKADPVKEVTDDIRELLNNMSETMYDAPGVGLAANQIGLAIRACVIDVGDDEETGRVARLYKLVNPEIIERSGKIKYEEGCLSIPGVHEVVERSSSVKVRSLNEEGEEIIIEAEGLLSICLQHEIDHLDGILFTDRLSGLKKRLVQKKLYRLEHSS